MRSLPLAIVVAVLAAQGCAREELGTPPPENAFYFPTSIVVAPPDGGVVGGRYAIVQSANFDLRYNAGWLSVVDLDAAVAAESDEARLAAIGEPLAVPSLGGPIAIDASRAWTAEPSYAVIGHRGSSLLSVVEITVDDGKPRLSCGDAEARTGLRTFERRTDCDDRHLIQLDVPELYERFHFASSDEVLRREYVRDPYAVAVYTDPSSGEPGVAVSFLSWAGESAKLLLFALTPDGEQLLTPRFYPGQDPANANARAQMVALDPAGIGAITVRPNEPGCPDATRRDCDVFLTAVTQIYGDASERSSVFVVGLPPGGAEARFYRRRLSGDTGGVELGEIVYSPDGSRAFASNHSPDSLVAFDSTLVGVEREEPGGGAPRFDEWRPAFDLVQAEETGGEPSGLAYLPLDSGDLLAVSSYDDDAIELWAVRGGQLVPSVRLEDVGDGPYALAAAPAATPLLLVGTFRDHGLSLVRLDPSSPAGATVVARISSKDLPRLTE